MVRREKWTLWSRELSEAVSSMAPQEGWHLAVAYDFTMEVLTAIGERAGRAREYDPSGAEPLRRVKRLRRRALFDGALLEPERLLELANQRFGLPSVELGYWASSLVKRPWVEMAGLLVPAD